MLCVLSQYIKQELAQYIPSTEVLPESQKHCREAIILANKNLFFIVLYTSIFVDMCMIMVLYACDINNGVVKSEAIFQDTQFYQCRLCPFANGPVKVFGGRNGHN